MNDLVKRAKALAYRAHEGQVDKAGRPYIEHVARVAAAVRGSAACANEDCNWQGEIVHWDSVGCSDPSCCSPATSPCPDCDKAEIVAWLHDVLEDCDGYDAEILSIGRSVFFRCCTLVRGMRAEKDYYASILRDPITLRVKLADIADNANEERLALLDPKTANRLREKYRKALEALT